MAQINVIHVHIGQEENANVVKNDQAGQLPLVKPFKLLLPLAETDNAGFDEARQNITDFLGQPKQMGQTTQINLSHLQPFLTHTEFLSISDTWYQLLDFMLLCGYSTLYFLNEFKDSAIKDLVINDYTVVWGYFSFVAHIFIHAYNIIQILRSEHHKKRKLLLEMAGLIAHTASGAATTLSFLSYHSILTGTAAAACAPRQYRPSAP